MAGQAGVPECDSGKGDDIEYLIDEENGYCTLNITFNGNVKNLEVEINRLSAGNA